ncbi:unnamed protein product [Amoebophrya sp. A120]|nr:unnamed protein product [Amoebophrya sp. A120]|eukprot:GSA120T00019227001.1
MRLSQTAPLIPFFVKPLAAFCNSSSTSEHEDYNSRLADEP